MMNEKIWKEPFDYMRLESFVDERGMLFEILRFKDHNVPGNGQLYTFSINPGQRRGDHCHLKKQEWFTCVHGEAIVLLSSSDGINKAIEISASRPKIIYAGPGTSHALINKMKETAVILSYGSKQHDPEDKDTYQKVAYEGFSSLEK